MKSNIQISTRRLILRPIQMHDADAVFRYRSNATVNQYQGFIPLTIKEVHNFITHRVSPEINVPGTWFQLVIIKKDGNELIGDIGIHFLDPDGFQVEVGCTLSAQQHGNGYATEALAETINYLFCELSKHRIIASVDPGNLPSIKMVERLEFRKEAHFRKSLFINGDWVDDVVYAILKEEWNEKR